LKYFPMYLCLNTFVFKSLINLLMSSRVSLTLTGQSCVWQRAGWWPPWWGVHSSCGRPQWGWTHRADHFDRGRPPLTRPLSHSRTAQCHLGRTTQVGQWNFLIYAVIPRL